MIEKWLSLAGIWTQDRPSPSPVAYQWATMTGQSAKFAFTKASMMYYFANGIILSLPHSS